MEKNISRRNFIVGGAATLLAGLGVSRLSDVEGSGAPTGLIQHPEDEGHDGFGMVGAVDPERNGFDPLEILVDWV